MKILVVGAGIAGSAAACMLDRDGHDVRLVDAAAEPYSAGYQILLDDTALTILDQIGALDQTLELSAPAASITISRRDKILTTIDTPGYRSARRGDLVGAISRHVAETVPMHFGRALTGIEQRLRGVSARFNDGSVEDYDLLIGADGLNSTVRQLAVETDNSYVYDSGRINLWVNVPGRVNGSQHSAFLFGEGIGAQVFPYTDKDETLVLTPVNTRGKRVEELALLQMAADLLLSSPAIYHRFAEGVLSAAPENIRINRFAQVRAPRWHARNVVLIGDAAHCIDPLSGAGAHAGLLGAAIFAEELRNTPQDISAAATRYTRRTQGFVRPVQLLTAGLVEGATSHTIPERLAAARSLTASPLTTRRVDVPTKTYSTVMPPSLRHNTDRP